MKQVVLKYVSVFALVILSGAMLMDVSYRVQSIERVIKKYDHKIAKERENIRVLKAEWAYLNAPDRLEKLVSGNLDLISPEAAKLINDMDDIPDIDPNVSIFVPPRSPLHRDISYVPGTNLPTPVLAKPSIYKSSASTSDMGGAQ